MIIRLSNEPDRPGTIHQSRRFALASRCPAWYRRLMKRTLHALLQGMTLTCVTLLAGCQTAPTMPPLRTVPQVDLQRFMGDWYVVAHIPTVAEKAAFNA